MLRIFSVLICVFAVLAGCGKADVGGSLVAGGGNSCVKLIQAAELAKKITAQDDTTIDGMRAHLAAGLDAMQLARTDLEKQLSCNEMHELLPSGDSFKYFASLLNLFWLEVEIAQQDGDTGKVLNACLDFLRITSAVGHGGNMADQLGSFGRFQRVADRVHAMQGSLTNEQCAHAISILEGVLASIEPVEVVVKRETGTIDFPIDSQEHSFVLRQEKLSKMCRAMLTLCDTELAIRAHHLAQGQLPTSLSVLVGKELRVMPIDPWTSRPLVYRVEGGSFVLFAEGPDGEVKL